MFQSLLLLLLLLLKFKPHSVQRGPTQLAPLHSSDPIGSQSATRARGGCVPLQESGFLSPTTNLRQRLHRRKLRDEVHRDLVQVSQHLPRALEEGRLVVTNPVLLAEGLHEAVHLLQLVARDLWEEMMVDLELKPPTEPIDERRARDVPGCGHLRRNIRRTKPSSWGQ